MNFPRSKLDLLVYTKLFYILGLAGVYHIGDHYEHETSRGVEDVSCMARVMYGESHFDRFSPTRLCHSLSRGVRYINSSILLCKIKLVL